MSEQIWRHYLLSQMVLIAKEAELFREQIEGGGMFPRRFDESEEVQMFQR